MFAALPKKTEARILGKQALRSGTSVGANYREASRARSRAEFVSKCGDSLRELEESAYWLELLVDAGIVRSDKLSSLRQECDRVDCDFRDDHQSSQRQITSAFCLLTFLFAFWLFPAIFLVRRNAPLAQLAEQVTLNHWVVGSIPTRCSLRINDLQKSRL